MKKIIFKGAVTIFFSFFLTIACYAQFYNTGSAPFLTDWKQIKTPQFRIIFPVEWEKPAYELASSLKQSIQSNILSFDSIQVKPIEIVCYNQNVFSNGYVSWAPSRMELITTPPQGSYAQNWIDQLALHEYRHVVQMNSLYSGFTKGLTWLFGEWPVGAMAGFLPLWYLEGDAVVAETGLTDVGRGREPEFMKEIKAIELQMEKRPSYDQAYLGSYKTYTPDYYAYGYQMVAWGKANYGNELFNSALHMTANKPFTLAPFYLGLKKSANLSKLKLYDSTFNYLKNSWKEDKINSSTIDTKSIETTFKSHWVNYTYPFIYDSSIFALRTSADDIARIVKLSNGKEKIVYTIGSFYGKQIGYGKRLAAWEEYRSDLRFEQKNFSVIRVFDLVSKQSFILENKERHFSPSIDSSDRYLACIQNDLSNGSFLEIYSLARREKIISEQHPLHEQLSYNCWTDSTHVAVVSLGDKGKSIYSFNIISKEWKKLFGPVLQNISHLSSDYVQLFFTFTISGTQQIYSFDLSDSGISQITRHFIASDFASGNSKNKKLVYAEYGSAGFKLKELSYAMITKQPLDSIDPVLFFLADEMKKFVPENKKSTESLAFSTEKYPRFQHALNYHSRLVPFYIDLLNFSSKNLEEQVHWGFNLFSQNSLSSLTTAVGLYLDEGYVHFRPIITYSGWIPVFTFSMDYGGPPQIIALPDTISLSDEGFNTNLKLSSGISVPLRFHSSRYFAGLTPAVDLNFRNISFATANNYRDFEPDYSQNGINYFTGILQADMNLGGYIYSKSSRKDILPRWGLSIYGSLLETKQENPYYKYFNSKYLSSSFYLPGIARHHSLKLRAAIEEGLNNRTLLPRGYNKNSFNVFSSSLGLYANYTLPLLYPDLSIGPVAYLKQIYGTVFYDFMQFDSYKTVGNSRVPYSGQIESVGAELAIETHFLRFFWPITPAVSYSYLFQEESGRINFSVSTNYSFSLAAGYWK